ncbi:MAG: hypothetical protein AVDCRST_MAG11-1953 [uncultured Gemmatimonadaceae bacterium]|uniref:OsmC/Ohr family protein n=1 Tax=uncultured Gemmatimonadaceae bacterium TaxID=246130 RepID=A0A6J4KZV3_9BACT|nr:MAG: hypothetical protein AVDCRST_MAG11-1953 [uncultured Gemmatimonadaceae bacterium]
MKITLLGDDAVRLEAAPGPLTVEAERADQPYSPFHMLGSSLALCEYSVLASWAAHAKLPTDDLAVEVRWTVDDKAHQVSAIALTLHWPSLPEARREAAKRATAICPIHRTLSHPPPIAVEVRQ